LKFIGRFGKRLAIGFGGGTKRVPEYIYISSISVKNFCLPLAVSLPTVRVALRKAENIFGGAGRLGMDVITGFVIVDVAVVSVVDGFNNVFVVVVIERLFAVADVKFPFACARI